MGKLKVGLLEDERALLKDIKNSLESTGLVEVVFYSSNTDDFFVQFQKHKIQALVLDIDLAGHSITGIDVAAKCKLPVIFRSGHTDRFNSKIEDVSHSFDFPVERLRKVTSDEVLINVLKKFIKQVDSFEKSKVVQLNLVGKKSTPLSTDNIVYLTTDGADASNLIIYFNDKAPEMAIDLRFIELPQKGFPMDIFMKIHRSFYINIDKVKNYIKPDKIILEVMNKKGVLEEIELKIAEDNQPKFRKIFIK